MKATEITSLVSRRHPDYDEMYTHWSFLQATYDGGRKWFEENIFRYVKEGEKEYKARVERAYRFNHTREVVDLVNKYLFRSEVVRNHDVADEAICDFWRRSTRRGAGINSYMRYLSKLASINGRIWVVVDSVDNGDGESKAEADTQIYSYEVLPQNVLDMSYDEAGQLNWILIRETARDDENPFSCTGNVYARYRLWTRDKWFLIKEEPSKAKATRSKGAPPKSSFKLEDEGEHGLGVVPVFSVDHMPSESLYTAPSMIADIAYLDRAVANYLSNLDAIIQDQTFSQLAMPAQGMLPGEEGHSKLVEAGTKRIFTYDGEGGQQPFFLSPDPKQAELIITAVKQIINEIYHVAGVSGERTKQDNSQGIDNSSGVAKAFDFERVNSLLTSKASALQRAELYMLDLVMRWSGKEEGLGDLYDEEEILKLVAYPTSFDARGMYEELDISNRLELLTAPIELKQYQLKRVVKKMYPYISDTERAELEKAIDEMEDASEAMVSQFTLGAEASGTPEEDLKAEEEQRDSDAGDGKPPKKGRDNGRKKNAKREA